MFVNRKVHGKTIGDGAKLIQGGKVCFPCKLYGTKVVLAWAMRQPVLDEGIEAFRVAGNIGEKPAYRPRMAWVKGKGATNAMFYKGIFFKPIGKEGTVNAKNVGSQST